MAASHAVTTNMSPARRGLIPGGSAQLNRYKILRRRKKRVNSLNNQIPQTTYQDGDSSNSDHSLETDPDTEIQKVVDYVQNYANDLYLPLRERHPVNLVYSPLGFCISATMLKLGCSGLGQEELTRALFPGEEDCCDITVGIPALLGVIKGHSDAYTLKHAYKIYVDTDHKPKPGYIQKMKALYRRADIEEIDFSNDEWEQVSNEINHWAHTAGNKKLGDILTKRTMHSKIIFVNPVYFMGNWVHPFNPALTHETKFFLNERETVNVLMMKSGILKNLLYSAINKLCCRALVLPYKGDRLGLVIFLPNQRGGLAAIETGLESLSPKDYLAEMSKFRRKISSQSGFQVYLPSFSIDCTLDFERPMKEMGIETIFLPGKADFSKLAHISPKDLSLTQILQKVVIDVTETGMAKLPERFSRTNNNATVSLPPKPKPEGSASDSAEESEIIEFHVDHPFYFQLVDMRSDLVVLAGACRNPVHGKDLGFKEFLEKYDIPAVPRKVEGGRVD